MWTITQQGEESYLGCRVKGRKIRKCQIYCCPRDGDLGGETHYLLSLHKKSNSLSRVKEQALSSKCLLAKRWKYTQLRQCQKWRSEIALAKSKEIACILWGQGDKTPGVTFSPSLFNLCCLDLHSVVFQTHAIHFICFLLPCTLPASSGAFSSTKKEVTLGGRDGLPFTQGPTTALL